MNKHELMLVTVSTITSVLLMPSADKLISDYMRESKLQESTIINAIMKVIGVITKKSGINLKKKNDPAWYKVIEKVTGEIDNYLDTPFRVILTPFIKDSIKRDKTAKILKALTLATMAILGVVDPSKIQPTINSIKELSGNFSNEIIQAITEHSLPKLTEILKGFLNSIKL